MGIFEHISRNNNFRCSFDYRRYLRRSPAPRRCRRSDALHSARRFHLHRCIDGDRLHSARRFHLLCIDGDRRDESAKIALNAYAIISLKQTNRSRTIWAFK